MSNIVQYDSTANLTPSDKGIQTAEIAGRRLGQFGQELAQNITQTTDAIQRHMEVMETSEIYKSSTEFEYNAQQGMDADSAKHEGDPHWFDTYRTGTLEPLLDQWKSGATTDRGKLLAASRAAEMRANLYRRGAGIQSAMDWAHFQTNDMSTLNHLRAQIYDNPTQEGYDTVVGTWTDYANESASHISDPEKREEARVDTIRRGLPELTLSWYKAKALAGVNQIAETGDPTKAPALDDLDKNIAAKTGFDNLGDHQDEVMGLRAQAEREGMEKFRTKDAAQRRQEDEAVDAALLPVETSLFQPNGSGGVTVNSSPAALDRVKQIATMPGAARAGARIESLLNAMHTATQDQLDGKERVSDQGTYNSLSNRIGSTTNPLTKAEVDQNFQNLSTTDYHFLREAASDSKTANPKINQALTELHRWQEQIKPAIDKSNLMSGVDQSGAVNFSHFSWDTEHKLRQAIDAGEDPQHAVQRLTDPRNANGFYRYIPQYQRTMSQSMDVVQRMANPNAVQPIPAPPGGVDHVHVEPRKQGESSEDYLKRTSH